MPRNGLGTFNRIYDWENDAANNIKIRADRMDAEMDGMATALSNSVAVDGQTPITGNLPMTGFKHTNVDDATARNEYAAVGQVQDGAFVWGGTDSGSADAYAITTSPVTTAYTAGQTFRFIVGAGNTNTGASTLAVNGLSAEDIKTPGGADVSAGMLEAGSTYEVVYDGTNFILQGSGALAGGVGGEEDVASASTTDIGGTGSIRVHITGTTGITSFGTETNRLRYVRFSDELTITHNATSLICPNGEDITTFDGMALLCTSDGSGNWRVWFQENLTTTIDTSSPSDSEVVSEQGIVEAFINAIGYPELNSNSLPGDSLDNVTESRADYVSTSGANGSLPDGFSVAVVLSLMNNSDYGVQFAQEVSSSLEANAAIRTKWDGTWSDWKRLLTEDDAAFTEFYESSEQSMTADSIITLSHGLSGEPTLIRLYIVCTSADQGYSVGDKLDITAMAFADGSGNNTGLAPVFDSSDIQIKCAVSYVAIVPNWGDGGRDVLSFGSWDLVVQAWR